MNSNLTFYTNPQSRGRIARWMLEEVGAPYETRVIEYGEPMKSPEYLAINPMGKVPAIRHNGKVVTECAAICAYLADAFPKVGLAPEPEQKADYYRWLFFAAGPLEAAITNKSVFGEEAGKEKQRMLGYGSYGQTMDALSHAVTQHSYIAGDKFTAADVYIGAHVGWGMQFNSMEKRPEFTDYFARVSDRAAYRRAVELDDALVGASA